MRASDGIIPRQPRAFDTIVWGGLLAGVLDAGDGVVAFGLKGMNPIQVLQYVASGLLGVSAFQGGIATSGLGALLHFFIAFVEVGERATRWGKQNRPPNLKH